MKRRNPGQGPAKPKKAARLVEIDQLLTVPQAAARLCMGKTKVYELINTNQLAYVSIPSRGKSVIRLSALTLNAWIKRQETLKYLSPER